MQISIGPVATIGNAEQVRISLLDAIASDSEIELDVSELSEVDLCFVQLVESARKYASERDKSLSLTASANPAVSTLLERGGFLSEADSDFLTFWFPGDHEQ
ncbi:STAS domain-containing protein [Erythrobacter sp. SCSIO 43205]|uniref:STAS domain-containing protein n=1 Tax=Erythrobacter sp. SCSIO 43205 TaxID=2779361 RepID=UPI001CA8C65D|nr:STAS domain-containing protein [Erythrobacter sp. SCSIO 43205]UAB77863.1 STAS domain-containing protein [Erythrobacter sp. SCSIO 43205]